MCAYMILKNGWVIDPRNGKDGRGDLWLKDGLIVEPESYPEERAKIVDCSGCWVAPGFVDMHVHLREPGEEYKETVQSGCRAAAAGGFTGVACMPNSNPVNDCGSVTRFILERAAACDARVYPVGAISEGSRGERLAQYAEMKMAGAVGVSDDGLPVVDSRLMRRAMEYAASHDMVVISHCEDPGLSRNGCMNEGLLSVKMGLRGIPAAAESTMVYRETSLARLTGARVHIAHVSCAESVEIIRAAKGDGVAVTAETAPHYFSLTEDAVRGYQTNAKMNPPLRTERDRRAIIAGLADGTLDAIATDHAPHSQLEKEVEFDQAANGIIGLETSLPLALELVHGGQLDRVRLVELLSCGPTAILGIPGGSLEPGMVADVTVIDPERRFVYRLEEGHSQGENSPFDGREFRGRAVLTMVGGRITNNELTEGPL